MPPRTIYLITSRNAPAQRAHFAIFVPAETTPDQGTLIQAVGAPMTGYILEFKRNYCPSEDSREQHTLFPIGEVDSSHIVDLVDGTKSSDGTPRDDIEAAACQIPTPGISDNFLAPVNDVCSLDCFGWCGLGLFPMVLRSAISGVRSGRWSLLDISLGRGILVLGRFRSCSRSGIRLLMGLDCSLLCGEGVRFNAWATFSKTFLFIARDASYQSTTRAPGLQQYQLFASFW